MRKLYLLLLMLTFSIFQFALAQNDVTKLGESLELNLYKAVTDKNWSALDAMMAPGFQSVHSDKIRNRNEALDYIKSIKFKDYAFNNFAVTQGAKNTIVITYELNYAEKIGEQPKSGKRTKNLSVWENVDGKWYWIAHAVFD